MITWAQRPLFISACTEKLVPLKFVCSDYWKYHFASEKFKVGHILQLFNFRLS